MSLPAIYMQTAGIAQPLCPCCGQAASLPDLVVTEDFVYFRGRLVHLTPAETKIFHYLWSSFGKARSKQQIYDQLYLTHSPDYGRVEIKIIDVYICKLRNRIPDLPVEIITIWSQGYVMRRKA